MTLPNIIDTVKISSTNRSLINPWNISASRTKRRERERERGMIHVRRFRRTPYGVKCRQWRTYLVSCPNGMSEQINTFLYGSPNSHDKSCRLRTVCDSFEYRRGPNKSLTVIQVVLRFQIRLHVRTDFTYFPFLPLPYQNHLSHKCFWVQSQSLNGSPS